MKLSLPLVFAAALWGRLSALEKWLAFFVLASSSICHSLAQAPIITLPYFEDFDDGSHAFSTTYSTVGFHTGGLYVNGTMNSTRVDGAATIRFANTMVPGFNIAAKAVAWENGSMFSGNQALSNLSFGLRWMGSTNIFTGYEAYFHYVKGDSVPALSIRRNNHQISSMVLNGAIGWTQPGYSGEYTLRLEGTYIDTEHLELTFTVSDGTNTAVAFAIDDNAFFPTDINNRRAGLVAMMTGGFGTGGIDGFNGTRAEVRFDDFSAEIVPEPSAAILISAAAGLLIARRRRLRNDSSLVATS